MDEAIAPAEKAVVRIPSTREELVESLHPLGQLLTAYKWARAVIVWAWVEPDTHGGDRRSKERSSSKVRLNASEFAALEIHGLRSFATVERYRNACDWAWSEGLLNVPRPSPGDVISVSALPPCEFPPPECEQPVETTWHSFEGDFAPNSKLADQESDEQPATQASHWVQFYIPKDEAESYIADVKTLMKEWDVTSEGDVVVQAVRECASEFD